MKKKRNPAIAALLGVLGYGLSFLYVGQPRLALSIALLRLITFPMLGWSRAVFLPWTLLVTSGLMILIFLINVLMPVIVAWRKREGESAWYQAWWAYVGLFVASLGLGLLYSTHRAQWFGFDVYRIPSTAMADALRIGDFIVTDSWAYRHNKPERGDVVVFTFPDNTSMHLVKRIIGMPGETVVLRDGTVSINGVLINEPYVRPEHNKKAAQESSEFHVPADGYFLLGDNRDQSYDSRQKGPVSLTGIEGKVENIWISYDKSAGFHFDRVGYLSVARYSQ